MTAAFVFPGQGSQSIGMMSALSSAHLIKATFDEASQVLGYDLWDLCRNGPEERLNATECTQPAMLAADVATFRLWRDRGGRQPLVMSGHSLGEFAALLAAEALTFQAAVGLVKFRGEAMRDAVPNHTGAMAAILGLEDPDIEAACAEAARDEVVEPANFNAPGQVVIAGHAGAVERAIAECKARGAKRAVLLPISVPCHSSLMRGAAERLGERLAMIDVRATGGVTVYGSDTQVHSTPDAIRAALVKQLYSPIFWAATVRTMIASGVTQLIECGPGKVLTALNRRIERNRDIGMFALETADSMAEVLKLFKR
jgi:[acyl-carrier-protein] S-malonyltransferase